MRAKQFGHLRKDNRNPEEVIQHVVARDKAQTTQTTHSAAQANDAAAPGCHAAHVAT